MAGERSFVVKLFADPRQLIKGFEEVRIQAGKQFGDAKKSIADLSDVFERVTIASAAAFAGLAAFAGKAVQAAMEDQAEQERLAQTLRNVAGATDETVASTEKFISSLAKTTTFSDSQLRPALSALVVATGDVTQAQGLLTLAQDISIATGTDLQQTSEALAKASNGNMKALQALSPTLRDNIKDGESFNSVLQELQANFGGAAQSAAGTLAGQMTILRNRFGEIVEQIGTAFLPTLEMLAGLLGGVATFIENNTSTIVFLGTAMATATGLIVAFSAAMKLYAVATAVATAANVAFAASLSATGIGAIAVVIGLAVGALVLAAQKSEGFRKAMVSAINVIIQSFEDFVNYFIWAYNTVIIGAINGISAALRFVGIDIGNLAPIAKVSFGEIGKSVDGATSRISIFNGTLASTLQNLKRFESSIQAENRARMASVGALDEYNKRVREQLKTTGGAAEKTKTAAEKLKEYTSVLKQAQSASRSFEDAQKRVGKAQESVVDANDALRAAEEALARAQQGGSPEQIAAAQRGVAAAERTLARAKFGQEEAIMAVRDAERKLAEVRGDPAATADDIRRAEIALAEAKFNVADTEDEQLRTTADLTEARRQLRIATDGLIEGDQELLPLHAAVSTAQEQLTTAAEAYADAIRDQNDALTSYKETLEELGKVAEMFPKIAARVGAPDLFSLTNIPQPPTATTGTFAGGGDINLNVTVGSGIVNGQQVGQEIAEYLRDFTRLNGPLSNFVAV